MLEFFNGSKGSNTNRKLKYSVQLIKVKFSKVLVLNISDKNNVGMKFSATVLISLFLILSKSVWGQVERERIESAFILKFISFIKSPIPVHKSYQICVLGDEKVYVQLSSNLKISHFEDQIPFQVVDLGKSVSHADCHLFVTGAGVEKIDSQEIGNSIHVTKNPKLFERSVIYLKKSEGRIKFDINYKWAQQHNLKINPKLLQVADYIEK